jgi:pyridoxal phosphate enzyme (YggS family)
VNDVATRLSAVRARIDAAVRRRGGGAVRLVGVSKKQPLEAIRAAHAAGLRDFGENYAQELRDKRAALSELDLRWHFIGPLQSNKVKLVVGAALVHAIDRASLLADFESRAAKRGATQDVLVQVNVAREAAKAGCDPDHVAPLLDAFAPLSHVRCRGLMLIPPLADAEATRPHFRALARLRDHLAATTRPGVELAELSMGMSDDFEVAIEEGATIVRVGTAVFGPRPG